MNKLNKILALGLIGLMSLCYSGYTADWYVATNGTGDGTSWATAGSLTGMVASASSGDVVWVSNGTYTVHLVLGGVWVQDEFGNWIPQFSREGITVRSKSGLPSDVVLNGGGAIEPYLRPVTMESSCWLIGCTVSNGYSFPIQYSSDNYGGGILGGFVSNCIIVNNETDSHGGGVSGCKVFNSLIKNNIGGRPGYGGGAHNSFLYNCTIINNETMGGWGGGAWGSVLVNTISWDNHSGESGSFTDDECTFTNSCSPSSSGSGNITNDPIFVSSTDSHLQSNSPCIDTGTNGVWTTGATDLDGNKRIWPQNGIVDMGVYEYGSQKDYPPPPPSKATNPMPTNNATKQSTATIVSWQKDTNTTGCIINFGLSGNMTNCGSTTSTNYNPGTLSYSSNYQWRIDATNADWVTTGDVWNLTVRDVTTIIEKNKLVVDNDFQVTGDSVLNNTEVDGTFKKIVKTGNTTTVTGKAYQWQTNAWVATVNTNENQCNKMIGIALGANSTANGMLTMGDLTVTNTDLSPGATIYVGSTAGEWTQTVPTNSTYTIRVIGYAIETNKIWIKTDGIWGQIE